MWQQQMADGRWQMADRRRQMEADVERKGVCVRVLEMRCYGSLLAPGRREEDVGVAVMKKDI